MSVVAQPLYELPELRKMGQRLVAIPRQKTRWRVMAGLTIVVRPLVYRSRHSLYVKGLCPICRRQESRSQFVAKSAESGEPVFTSMDVLLYGL
jgi:hypothetical protein